MSDQTLRDLLEERVADLSTRDLSAPAWERSREVRRRRAVVVSAVAVAAVAIGATLVVTPGREGAEPVGPHRPTPTQDEPAGPDVTVQGIPVWWSPDLAAEGELPWLPGSPMPREVDVDADLPTLAEDPIEWAQGAFGNEDEEEVVLLGEDGALRTLDVSRLDPLEDAGGNPAAVLGDSMLSPDGRTLVFPQQGHVMLVHVTTGEWSRVDTGDSVTQHVTWSGPDSFYLPKDEPFGTGPEWKVDGRKSSDNVGVRPAAPGWNVPKPMDNPHGRSRTGARWSAQSYGAWAPGIPVPDTNSYLSGPAYLAATGRPGARVLAFLTETERARFMDAPTVMGWLDEETVLYRSQADDDGEWRDLLIAWRVGTRQFHRVTGIEGGASGVSLSRFFGHVDAAEEAEDVPRAEPAGTYQGAPVWWAPTPEEEALLPVLPDSPLPISVDLTAAETGPVGEPALATFAGRGDQAWVLTVTGRVVEVDTSRLQQVADEAGNTRSPLSPHGLSLTGRRVFFTQNSSLEVLDLVTDTWTTIDTPDWLAEGARWVSDEEIWVPDELGETSVGTGYDVSGRSLGRSRVFWLEQEPLGTDDHLWGPVVAADGRTAQSSFLAGPVPGGGVTNPQGIVMRADNGDAAVLALDFGSEQDGGVRGKGCCSAVGWADSDTVLFVSGSSRGHRILAWDVGTDRLSRVSEIVGRGSIMSMVTASVEVP